MLDLNNCINVWVDPEIERIATPPCVYLHHRPATLKAEVHVVVYVSLKLCLSLDLARTQWQCAIEPWLTPQDAAASDSSATRFCIPPTVTAACRDKTTYIRISLLHVMCRDSEYRENNHNSLRVEHVNAFEFSSTTSENIRLPSCSYIEHDVFIDSPPAAATWRQRLTCWPGRSCLWARDWLCRGWLPAARAGC